MALGSTKQTLAHIGHGSKKGRPGADFYETPPQGTYALLHVEEFQGPVWEPACGKGAISRILEQSGLEVVSTDLFDRGFGQGEVDFLTAEVPDGVRDVITNPPFTLAEDFARRGAAIIKQTGGKLAMLQRLAWIETPKRAAMFEETNLSQVWILSHRIPLTPRPDWEGEVGSSAIPFAWFVWEAAHEWPPVIGWVDWRKAMPGATVPAPSLFAEVK